MLIPVISACLPLGGMPKKLGRAYDLNHQSDRSTAAYSSVLNLAHQHRDRMMECRALNGLAAGQAHTYHNLDAALLLLEEARQVAQASANPTGLAKTSWNLAQLNFYLGKYRRRYPTPRRH